VSQFVDECNLHAKGGNGGAGAVSFRREAYVARGGPDGGDGGDGGSVWLVADRNVASLIAFQDHPHRRATDGGHGSGQRRHGARGKDLVVSVPEGTQLRGLDGAPVADLVNEGDRVVVAQGGRGGRGNARFLSNRRRAPSFAEQGELGEERWLRLELKLLADVAIVGFPNVGKSTLISRISAARPKIADYPFTTLEPNLGVVRMEDGFEMVVADIPGLIEGAHEGKGLGHQFLRHIERARVLCILLDLAVDTGLPAPADQQATLLDELGRYQPELLERGRLVVGSRGDLASPEPGWSGLAVSAVTGTGVRQLVGRLADLVREARQREPEPSSFVVHRPAGEGFRVERTGDGWTVVGRQAERAVALNDLTNAEALAVAHERLRRIGVDRALARAGVQEGDTVHIGRLTFTYEDGHT
jgi:GTP-binding protein